MGDLFKADTPRVAKAPVPKAKTNDYYKNVNTNVNYTPINTGRVPRLVGSSTFDYIRGMDPTGLNAGGITAGYQNGTINLNTSPFRQSQVQGMVDTYNDQFADLEQQRGTVAPGYSNFRQSALQRLDDSRQRALSNLRDNFARRGVLGSSFGEDAINRQQLEFDREAERINTEAYLKEIELTNQLSQQQYAAGISAFETGLNELNFQSEIAARLTSQADQFLSQSNAILADMAKADASNRTNIAMADAQNQLTARLAEVQADLSRASGRQRTELANLEARLQTQLANAKAQNSAYGMQYEQQASQDAGIGSLIGKGISVAAAPMTGGASLFALPYV